MLADESAVTQVISMVAVYASRLSVQAVCRAVQAYKRRKAQAAWCLGEKHACVAQVLSISYVA